LLTFRGRSRPVGPGAAAYSRRPKFADRRSGDGGRRTGERQKGGILPERDTRKTAIRRDRSILRFGCCGNRGILGGYCVNCGRGCNDPARGRWIAAWTRSRSRAAEVLLFDVV